MQPIVHTLEFKLAVRSEAAISELLTRRNALTRPYDQPPLPENQAEYDRIISELTAIKNEESTLFKEVQKRFKLKKGQGFQSNLVSTTDKIHPDLFPWLIERLQTGKVFFKHSEIIESIAQPNDSEWFAMGQRDLPGKFRSESFQGVIPESIRNFILENGYGSEVEILWIKSNSRSEPQRFWALPYASLGRGLDHPCFDPDSLKRPNASNEIKFDQRRRFGESIFNEKTFLKGKSFGAFFDSVLPWLAQNQLSVKSPSRLCRQDLPNANWAYAGDGFLYCRRDVREKLMRSGVMSESEFHPALIEEKPTDGREYLNQLYGPPIECSMNYDATPEDLRARLQTIREESRNYEAFISQEKLSPEQNLVKQLERLSELTKKKPQRFQPGLRPKLHTSDAKRIPSAWMQVLTIANGFEADRFESHFPLEEAVSESAEFPKHYFPIARTMGGEYTALDLRKTTKSGDCRVVNLGETFFMDSDSPVEREWSSIGEYLEEVVDDIEQA